MEKKKMTTILFFAILIGALLIVPNSVATNDVSGDYPGDPRSSNEELSQKVHPEFSDTALEYLVNEPIDTSINKTITDSNPIKSISYTEKESIVAVPDLNNTAGTVLFTNESIISILSPVSYSNEESDAETDSDPIIDAWDPNRPPASPLPVTKEGHWFPNMDHSRIRYEINTQYLTWFSYPFHLDLSAGDDPYARYFRIYWDGNLIHDQVISPYSGFHGDFSISAWPGSHRLEFEIWSGYYSDHPWKIDLFKPLSPDPLGDPTTAAQVTGEYFPFTPYGRLRWNVYMGQQTDAEIKINSVDDPYLRDLKIFVDGVQIQSTYAPCDITVPLGSYTHGSMHEIMLEVSWCDYREWGYEMPKFRVHYGGAAAEIDYLVCDNGAHNHRPHDDVLNYMQVWYVEHGYQRFSLFIDDAINTSDYPGSSVMTNDIYNDIRTDHFDYDYMNGVKYVLFGHDDGVFEGDALGWADAPGERVFIADQTCDDYAFWNGWLGGFNDVQVEKVLIMHECGHSISIIERSGDDEQYCSQTWCVMALCGGDNCDDNPWYCQNHWNLRQFPAF